MTEELKTTEAAGTEPVEVKEAAATEAVADTDAAPVTDEPKKRAKKLKRQVTKGRVTIQCTYNNTIISIADMTGGVLGWSSSGHMGFKGAKKSTPYAATQVVADVTEKVKKYGVVELEVFVKGVGSGREASIRSLANNGFTIVGIKDTTPIPHNGCRPRRPRRI